MMITGLLEAVNNELLKDIDNSELESTADLLSSSSPTQKSPTGSKGPPVTGVDQANEKILDSILELYYQGPMGSKDQDRLFSLVSMADKILIPTQPTNEDMEEDNQAATAPPPLSRPRKKALVMVLGNQSSGKSSFINWYFSQYVQRVAKSAGSAVASASISPTSNASPGLFNHRSNANRSFTFVTSGKARKSLNSSATLVLFPQFQKVVEQVPGLVDSFATEVIDEREKYVNNSASESASVFDDDDKDSVLQQQQQGSSRGCKKSPNLVTFIEGPSLSDASSLSHNRTRFDQENAILAMAEPCNLILFFMDFSVSLSSSGGGTGRASMSNNSSSVFSVIERLYPLYGSKIRFFFTRADILKEEGDRQRVLIQLAQQLTLKLLNSPFDLPVIYIPQGEMIRPLLSSPNDDFDETYDGDAEDSAALFGISSNRNSIDPSKANSQMHNNSNNNNNNSNLKRRPSITAISPKQGGELEYSLTVNTTATSNSIYQHENERHSKQSLNRMKSNLNTVCEEIDKCIQHNIQNALNSLENDSLRIVSRIDHILKLNRETERRNSNTRWTSLFLALLLIIVPCLILFQAYYKDLIQWIPKDHRQGAKRLRSMLRKSLPTILSSKPNDETIWIFSAYLTGTTLFLFLLLRISFSWIQPSLKSKQVKYLVRAKEVIQRKILAKKRALHEEYFVQAING